MSVDQVFRFWCLIDDEKVPFSVHAGLRWSVDELMNMIQQRRPRLQTIDITDIVFWKLNEPIPVDPDKTLAQRIPSPFTDFSVELDRRTRKVLKVFSGGLAEDHLHIIVKLPASKSPSSSEESNVAAYKTLKRQHPPDYLDSTKRLKSDDIFSSDPIFDGLMDLWNSAWGQNPETTFEIRTVDRDGTLPDVHTPRTLRQEYVIALKFAILIARGGRPSEFKHHCKNASHALEVDEPLPESENESNLDPAMQPNPFISPDPPDPDQAGAVTCLGHPGIGKTLFLVYVLVCRMLASLPSIYMDKPDHVYIIDSSGVRRINSDIGALNHGSITEKYWCLVDSNDKLESVPEDIYSLGTFIIQSASPRNKRVEWWTKYTPPVRNFFMKEWSLSELIMGRAIQKATKASELELKTFLDRFIPSAREAFAYAVDQKQYERFLRSKLSALGRETIPKIVDSAHSLSFDRDVPSHHLVLITPSETNRSQHLVEIPTRFLYDQIISLAKIHALDAAFLLYEAFKEVNETNSAAGHMYEDFTRYLVPLGGQWPVVSMKKFPRRQKISHWKTTGTEKADACLCLGRGGGPPFEFATAPLTDNATFSKLKCMGFCKDERLVLEDGFYFPLIKTQATFDAFVYHAETCTATVLQVTVSNRHSVNNAGFEWLKSLGVEKVYFVGITPVGASLDLPFGPEWDDSFVAKVYHLPMEFVRNNFR